MMDKLKSVNRITYENIALLVLYIVSLSSMFMPFENARVTTHFPGYNGPDRAIELMSLDLFESAPVRFLYLIVLFQLGLWIYSVGIRNGFNTKGNIALIISDFLRVSVLPVTILNMSLSNVNITTYLLIVVLIIAQVVINVLQVRHRDEIIVEDFSSRVRWIILASTVGVFGLWVLYVFNEILSDLRDSFNSFETFYIASIVIYLPLLIVLVGVYALRTYKKQHITRRTLNKYLGYAPLLYLLLSIAYFITEPEWLDIDIISIIYIMYLLPLVVANIDMVAKVVFVKKDEDKVVIKASE